MSVAVRNKVEPKCQNRSPLLRLYTGSQGYGQRLRLGVIHQSIKYRITEVMESSLQNETLEELAFTIISQKTWEI